MLTYQLDPRNTHKLYEQLYFAIRADIEEGRLLAASKLPSKRALAQHLGISVITVESAYRQLAAEGYIETQERRGYFVNELPSLRPCESLRAHSPASRPYENPASAGESSIRATPLLADFSGSDRSGNLFPFHIWAKNVRRTLSEASKGLLLRTSYDNRGAEELRCAIARHLLAFRGLDVSPEQIVIGAGAQDLYGVLVQLLGRDRTFAIENPGYPALRTHYELGGTRVVGIPVDEKGLDVAVLEASEASIAHCTPAHQFPTGSVLGAVRRRELLEWAQQDDGSIRRYIIEDDYDSEFRLRGRPIPPLCAQDRHESVIYLNTFTRSLGSVFRIAYLVLPFHLLSSFNERFSARSCMVGALEQLELARFITSGDYERHVNRQRTTYRRLQDTLVAQLSTGSARSYISFKGVGAGLHFLMTVDSSAPSEYIEAAALERGIRLVNIDNYRFEKTSSSIQTDVIEQRSDQTLRQNRARTQEPATESHTYMMNVSGLDESRADKIAAALSAAILAVE